MKRKGPKKDCWSVYLCIQSDVFVSTSSRQVDSFFFFCYKNSQNSSQRKRVCACNPSGRELWITLEKNQDSWEEAGGRNTWRKNKKKVEELHFFSQGCPHIFSPYGLLSSFYYLFRNVNKKQFFQEMIRMTRKEESNKYFLILEKFAHTGKKATKSMCRNGNMTKKGLLEGRTTEKIFQVVFILFANNKKVTYYTYLLHRSYFLHYYSAS